VTVATIATDAAVLSLEAWGDIIRADLARAVEGMIAAGRNFKKPRLNTPANSGPGSTPAVPVSAA
jgi:hypothetical protein